MPIAHVHRDRTRSGHENESATGLTKLLVRALLDSDLESLVGRRDLHVAGPDSDARPDSSGDELTLEDQLGEPPVPAVLAHPHYDAAWAPPDALARRLEPTGFELAELIRDGLLGSLRRRPFDGLFTFGRWASDDA